MADHWVPQFYLKYFHMASTNEKIFAYGRNGKGFATNVKNVAAENDFYAVRINGKKSKLIEQMHSLMEGDAKPVIDEILKFRSIANLSEGQRVVVANFIAQLCTRTKGNLERDQNLAEGVQNKILEIIASHKTGFFREMKKVCPNMSDAEAEQLRQDILAKKYIVKLDKKSNPTRNFFAKLALENAAELVEEIYTRQWHLFESFGPRLFVTSDNPLVIIKPPGHPLHRGVGIKNGIIALPISPKLVIIINDTKSLLKTENASRGFVDLINTHEAYSAHQFIFSNIASKDFQKMMDATVNREPEKVNFS